MIRIIFKLFGILSKVLDATFDDVLQLAIPRMPSSISGIVRIAIRDYINLNNTELINKYSGPVLMIRRTEDEIIAEYVVFLHFPMESIMSNQLF